MNFFEEIRGLRTGKALKEEVNVTPQKWGTVKKVLSLFENCYSFTFKENKPKYEEIKSNDISDDDIVTALRIWYEGDRCGLYIYLDRSSKNKSKEMPLPTEE